MKRKLWIIIKVCVVWIYFNTNVSWEPATLMSLKGFHVVLVRRISVGSAASVCPSSTALSLSGAFWEAGASPVCLGARGALCPRHAVSSSQVGNIETDNHSHSCSRQRSIRSHQLVPKCMSLARKEAREPAESLRGNRKNMHTEKHLAPVDPNPKPCCCDAWSV